MLYVSWPFNHWKNIKNDHSYWTELSRSPDCDHLRKLKTGLRSSRSYVWHVGQQTNTRRKRAWCWLHEARECVLSRAPPLQLPWSDKCRIRAATNICNCLNCVNFIKFLLAWTARAAAELWCLVNFTAFYWLLGGRAGYTDCLLKVSILS